MKQERRITYRAGITRTPSDFLCADGELAECINLTTDNEELKPMVQPATFMTGVPELLYVHRFDGQTRYVTNYQGSIHWGTKNGESYADGQSLMQPAGTPKITSIGKTLIVTDTTGIHYFVWKQDGYTGFTDLPDLDIRFSMWGGAEEVPLPDDPEGYEEDTYLYTVYNVLHTENCIWNDDEQMPHILNGKQDEYNELVNALYSKNKKLVATQKGFCQPFMVRAAIRLYDGTYYKITNPVAMFPSVTQNSYARYFWKGETMRLYTVFSELCCTMEAIPPEFADIIEGVDVFVSDGIDIYNTAKDQPLEYGYDRRIFDGVYQQALSGRSLYRDVTGQYEHVDADAMPASPDAVKKQRFTTSLILARKTETEIVTGMKETSVFYKICSLGTQFFDGKLTGKIDAHTLENLTTQTRLKEDDFYSHSKMVPDIVFAYNSRINLAGVSRTIFGGYGHFMPFDNDSSADYDFYVTVRTDGGDKIVHHREESTYEKQGFYFFYPDRRATHVTIMKGNQCVCDHDLKEHNGLNGAVFFDALPRGQAEPSASGQRPEADTSPTERLVNQIVTSEVNNPWVFKAAGYNSVGVGTILAVSTATMALSQDQFGRTDLIVFTDNGIWGMQVDRTGLYESIHPMTRDVLLSAGSVTQADYSVFFVSKKGLMVVSDKGVSCLSERMNGRPFNTASLPGLEDPIAGDPDEPIYPWGSVIAACQDGVTFLEYIRDDRCRMAYDYTDSRLLVINPAYPYAFACSMADGSISKTILPATMFRVVNAYPDYLLQDAQGNVYTLYGKQREDESEQRQTAFLLTRPMKLAGPAGVASLRELMNVGTWDRGTADSPLSKVMTEVWVSDDQRTWYQVSSRFGAAAKYFRLGLYIRMLPSERLSGTILMEQARRENNMRHE